MYFFRQQRQSLEPAAHLTAGLNSIYQQADRQLVGKRTQGLLFYYHQGINLTKSWEKEYRSTLPGYFQIRMIIN